MALVRTGDLSLTEARHRPLNWSPTYPELVILANLARPRLSRTPTVNSGGVASNGVPCPPGPEGAVTGVAFSRLSTETATGREPQRLMER